MTKEQISSSYLADTKVMYLENPYPPNRRKALILGWAGNNIAQAIATELNLFCELVTCFKESECNAAELYDVDYLDQYDIIVFNNGRTHLDWFENQSEEQIHKVIFDCLTATMIGVNQFIDATLDSPFRKTIVCIGSMAYNHVLNGSAPYCAAKAGLAHFVRCIAYELAPKNYNVYCVHPSNVFDSPMSEATIQGLMEYRKLDRADALAYWGDGNPNAHFLLKSQIGKLVATLCKEDLYLSGANIEMAGGQR